jgi:hypothetical protein
MMNKANIIENFKLLMAEYTAAHGVAPNSKAKAMLKGQAMAVALQSIPIGGDADTKMQVYANKKAKSFSCP